MDINEGISESLDNIFAAVIVGGIDTNNMDLIQMKKTVYQYSVNKFLATYSDNIFEGCYSFLYTVLSTLKVKLFTKNQLESLVDQNADNILKSPTIDLSEYSVTTTGGAVGDEEKIEAFKIDLFEKFAELSNRYVSEEEFNSSIKLYNLYYKDKLMEKIALNMAMIMSPTGYDDRLTRGRTRHYQGADDAQKYYNTKIAIIRALEEENSIKDTLIDDKWLEDEAKKDVTGDEDAIVDMGIPEIDDVHGKLRRGNIIEFMGPAKGGKTTMATYLAERCLSAGLNVAIWPLEGEKDEWTSLIQAIMVRRFKTNSMVTDKKRILERRYESEYEKQSVLSARQILATDKSRGRLSFIGGAAYIENFIDVLDNHYENKNAFDVIVIDSPILVLSMTGRGKVERISEAYTLLKNYVSNKMKRKALCILTAQLKQDVVDMLRKNPKETIDVTAGGESAETIRTPDYVIGLMSTKNERSLGQMKIYDVAVRHGASFDDCYIGCQLGCGYFFSDPALNA